MNSRMRVEDKIFFYRDLISGKKKHLLEMVGLLGQREKTIDSNRKHNGFFRHILGCTESLCIHVLKDF